MTASRFRSALHAISDGWMDFNGHMSMKYYPMLFEQLGYGIFEAMGLGRDYFLEKSKSVFTLETHLRCLSELRPGDEVYSIFHYVAHDEKKLVYAQELYRADGRLSATFEVLTIHVDTAIRKSVPFPRETLTLFDELAAEAKTRPRLDYLERSIEFAKRR